MNCKETSEDDKRYLPLSERDERDRVVSWRDSLYKMALEFFTIIMADTLNRMGDLARVVQKCHFDVV